MTDTSRDRAMVRQGPGQPPRRLVVLASVVGMCLVLAAIGGPWATGPLLLGLSVLVAVAMSPDADRASRLTVAVCVPSSVAIVAVLNFGVAKLAAAAGVNPWSDRPRALLELGLLCAALALVAVRRGGRVDLGLAPRTPWIAAVAALGLGLVIVTANPFEMWSRTTGWGTDFFRHVTLIQGKTYYGPSGFGAGEYPGVLHDLAAWVNVVSHVGASPRDVWTALFSVVWVLLVLLVWTVSAAAGGVCRELVRGAGWAAAASGIAAFVVFNTTWFAASLTHAHVMNLLCAVMLSSIVLLACHMSDSSATVCGVYLLAVCATVANAWTYVVPAAGGALVAFVLANWRTVFRAWTFWGAAVICGVLTLNPLVPYVVPALGLAGSSSGLLEASQQAVETASTAAVSGLSAPEWWWAICALAGIGALWRAGRISGGRWTWTIWGSWIGSGVVLLWLYLGSRTVWSQPGYYPAKALWTCLILILPVGVAGAVGSAKWVVGWFSDRHSAPLVGWAIAGGAVVLASLVWAGRCASDGFNPVRLVRTDVLNIPFSLVAADELNRRSSELAAEQSGIIFGLVPDATVGQILSGFVGTADSIAMEGLTWTGVDSESWGKVKSAVASHDYLAICYWLKANPDANRISGPNGAAGADWLVKAGCPAEYVRSDRWLLLRFPGKWFAGTSVADGVFEFPTWQEYAEAKGLRDE